MHDSIKLYILINSTCEGVCKILKYVILMQGVLQ
jgi:hypothetical protein